MADRLKRRELPPLRELPDEEWELVTSWTASGGAHPFLEKGEWRERLERIRVPGGWLYRNQCGSITNPGDGRGELLKRWCEMIFIPDQ